MNDLFLRALRCENTCPPPIWIMRQAGRYLPEYRALRAKHSFQSLVHTPELAAQVTSLPIDLLGFDAAILFSDILVIAEPFGFRMELNETVGLKQGMQLIPPTQPTQLPIEMSLQFVPDTIRKLKQTLSVPLIGFCGGPYTVCHYMKQLTPAWLDKITDASIQYLNMQIKAGVDAIQIFDSWAGLLSPEEFKTLSLPYLSRLVKAIQPFGIPIILFCRGSSRFIQELSSLQPAAIGFDWEMDIAKIRLQMPASIAIQGNLDPQLLKGPLSTLQAGVDHLLAHMQDRPGYIFNLGHGIQPDTPVENVRWLLHHIRQTAAFS